MAINTKAAPVTLLEWIGALRGCFTTTYRANGTKDTHLSGDDYWIDIRDDLHAVVFAAHGDELPNDWRFSTVNRIVNYLAYYGRAQGSPRDVESYLKVGWDIAEALADSYTSQNVSWVAEDVGRVAFRDDYLVSELMDSSSHIGNLCLLRQQEEIEWMVQIVLTRLEALAS